MSGADAGTTISGDSRIRSGSPIDHSSSLPKSSGGGRSAGLPSGAPLSAQVAIFSISSSLSEMSSLNCWMPMSFSMNHGGMAPRLLRSAVRALMARAQGRTCS